MVLLLGGVLGLVSGVAAPVGGSLVGWRASQRLWRWSGPSVVWTARSRLAVCCDGGLLLRRRPVLVRMLECDCRGKPLPFWVMTAASVDVVPFLKASWWLRSIFPHAPGENPRSLDPAVVAPLRRDLLEDTALELTTGGSPMVVWRSGCFGDILPRQSLFFCPAPRLILCWVLTWCFFCGVWALLAGSWWWSASGGALYGGGVVLTGCSSSVRSG